MIDTETLVRKLMLNKPNYDGEDTNYDVSTIEDAITIIKKYAEIEKIVDEYNSAVIPHRAEYLRRIRDVFMR